MPTPPPFIQHSNEYAVGRSPLQQISSQPQQISVEHAVGSGLRRTGSMKEQLEYIMNAVDRIDAMQKCILQTMQSTKSLDSAVEFDFGLKSLPIESEEDMSELSTLLQDRSKRRQLVYTRVILLPAFHVLAFQLLFAVIM